MTALSEVSKLRRTSKGRVGDKGPLTERARKEERASYLFMLPWLLGLGLITALPMLASLALTLTDYNLLQTPNWVGLGNFARMVDDERLLNALRVTFVYVFVSVPIQLVFALGLALILDRGLRGLAIYRSVLYLPSLLGGSVAVAVLWRQIFGQNGLINQLLALVGIEGLGWVSNPSTALGTLVILNVWTFGAPMIIFLAGLRQIPVMYYEAASVDGASKMRKFRSITIPLLSPIIFFNLILQIIGSFQAFGQAYIVSGGTGGPAGSTMFYTLYLYLRGFRNFDMGYAAAMAWLLLLIVGLLTLINFVAARYWVHYED